MCDCKCKCERGTEPIVITDAEAKAIAQALLRLHRNGGSGDWGLK